MKLSIHKRKLTVVGVIAFAAVLNLSFQNCAPVSPSFSQISEETVQKSDVLEDSGTEEAQNMCKDAILKNELVDCSKDIVLADGSSQSREQWELAKVKAAAAANPDLVPFKISYSFGKATDELAEASHQRAALTKDRTFFIDSTGFEYMPIPTSNNRYYKVDFNAAKARFASGESCFYDVAQLPASLTGNGGYFDFALALPSANKRIPLAGNAPLHHVVHHGFMDNCFVGALCATNTSSRYGAGSYGKMEYPGRLLTNAKPHVSQVFADGAATGVYEPQIVQAFFADFRDAQFKLSTDDNSIVKIGENYLRGQTTEVKVSDILDLKTIAANFDIAALNLSLDYVDPVSGRKFSGIHSSKQLIANLCAQANQKGTRMSVQYTPIVLDLGQKTPHHPVQRIITTSASEGVLFDMKGDGVKRQTAWIGGRIKLEDAVSTTGVAMKKIVSEEAEDGFLVIPNAQGKVVSSKQLFGANMEVNGQKYANGFEALIALAGKDCRGEDIKKQYLGPWDGSLYESVVKVWVDRNKNGISDDGEIISLREAGVPALNACYTTKYGKSDASGNETSIRAVMLFQNPMTASESEILSKIAGKDVQSMSINPIENRIAIDIIFKGAQE